MSHCQEAECDDQFSGGELLLAKKNYTLAAQVGCFVPSQFDTSTQEKERALIQHMQ